MTDKTTSHKHKHYYWFTDSIQKENVESNYWFLAEVGSNLMCFYRQHFFRTFHCMEKSTERIFYIKVIIKIVLNPRKKRDLLRFLTLTHPNLIKIKEIYETNEALFVVTEPYHMGVLDCFIDMKSYKERDVSRMIKSILEALAYLHSKKIFHRCVNPDNIVCIMENGNLVYKLDNSYMGSLVTDEVHASLVSSNLAFTAPELLRSTKVDFSADLWSVGLVTYFFLSGSIPFFDHSCKGSFTKLFRAKLNYDDIKNINFTTKDFIEHLVNLDGSQRMTALEALSHPWVYDGLNSVKPLQGLCEKLEKYKKMKMIRNKIDVVNSSTYDGIFAKYYEDSKEFISSPISCIEPLRKPKVTRSVIVTAESDFYFRFGVLANRKPTTYDYSSSSVCRVLRVMYKTPEVTIYEDAVRCQTHYSSVFMYNEYIPSLWKLLNIPIVADYEEWRSRIMAALLAIKQAREAKEEKERALLLAAEMGEEEEEDDEEDEDEDYRYKQSEAFSGISDQSTGTMLVERFPSSRSSSKDSNPFSDLDNNVEESLIYSMWPSHLKFSHMDHEEGADLAIPPIFTEKDLESAEVRLEDLYINKRLSEFEPDIQTIGELLVAKPKKKFQKRKSVFDFMLMVNHPEYFQPLYTPQQLTEADIKELVQTCHHIYDLYRYRPPFHPTQLGIDQFTVEQQGRPGEYLPNVEDYDSEHVNDQHYMLCRSGVSIKKETPPWLLDVENQVPYLIPITKFNSIIKNGIPVPDTCIQTPPEPLPMTEFTVYSLLEDPMFSRFNSFPNSQPPEILTATHYVPFNINPRHYRDCHCPKEEKLAKKCPYKKMVTDRMDIIKRTLRTANIKSKNSTGFLRKLTATTMNLTGLDELRLRKAAEEMDDDTDNFGSGGDMGSDGGEKCRMILGWLDNLEGEEIAMSRTEELDEDCIHLTGRPCRMDMFDSVGRFCALSKRGNTRLCCQNLYAIWRKMDRDEEKTAASATLPFTKVDYIPHLTLDKLEAKNKLAKRNLSVGQLVVNITEKPDVCSRYKREGVSKLTEEKENDTSVKQNLPVTIENELQKKLQLLKELEWLKNEHLQEQPQSQQCQDSNWTNFIYPEEKGEPLVWAFEVVM